MIMFKRTYFMNAKCTNSTGYCYQSKTGSYRSFTSKDLEVYKIFCNEIKKELLEIRPDGQFEVISFNRI